MASRLVLPHLVKRQLSAQAAPAKAAPMAAMNVSEPKVSTLENGLTLVTVEAPTPVTTLSLAVKAGSRFETYDQAGAAFALKVYAALGTKNLTALGINRNFQQVGTGLDVDVGRERVLYTIQTLDDKLDDVIDYFFDAVACQKFNHWEINDNLPRFKRIVDNVSPDVWARELVHRAAYRSEGLGNFTISPSYMVGKHKTTLMQNYVSKTITTQRSALVGIGIDHDRLTDYAKNVLQMESGQGPSNSSKYYGGEVRHDAGGKFAFVEIAAEVDGASSPKAAAAAILLERILGKQSHVKWGNSAAKLSKALKNNPDIRNSSFLCTHSDSSLLGVSIKAKADLAGKAVETVVGALRGLSVSEEELKAAKNIVLVEMSEKGPKANADSLANQVLLSKNTSPVTLNSKENIDAIRAITLKDVQALASKLSKSKLSMSAVGNLGSVPYLDTL